MTRTSLPSLRSSGGALQEHLYRLFGVQEERSLLRGTGYRLTAGDPPNSDMHAKSVRSEGTGMKGCRRLCSLEWWSSSRFGQREGQKEVSADAQRQLQTISTPTHPQTRPHDPPTRTHGPHPRQSTKCRQYDSEDLLAAGAARRSPPDLPPRPLNLQTVNLALMLGPTEPPQETTLTSVANSCPPQRPSDDA